MSAINPTSDLWPISPAKPIPARAAKAAPGGPASSTDDGAGPVLLSEMMASSASQAAALLSGPDRIASIVSNALIQRTYAAAGPHAGAAQNTIDHLR